MKSTLTENEITDSLIAVDDAIKEIKAIVDRLGVKNIPLCKRPSEKELQEKVGYTRLDNMRHDVFWGCNIKTTRFGADETVWTYPEGVEDKIDDDRAYKLWYTWHDAADPADLSTYHHVYYIEEVPYGKKRFLQLIKQLIADIE